MLTESPFTEIGLRDEKNATIIAATRSAADEATEVAEALVVGAGPGAGPGDVPLLVVVGGAAALVGEGAEGFTMAG